MKNKFQTILNQIIRHRKIVFPFVIIIAVAITVALALHAREEKSGHLNAVSAEDQSTSMSQELIAATEEPEDKPVPLAVNEDGEVFTLVATYYNAMALGDLDVLRSICDVTEDEEMLRIQETAKYLESFPVLEIYTKPGFEEGSTIAYVYFHATFTGQDAEYPGYQGMYISRGENGELYIKKSGFSEEANEYIKRVSTQEDVVEFDNRVKVEYDELIAEKPELLDYIQELDMEVGKEIGVLLARKVAEESQNNEDGNQNSVEETGVETSASEEGEGTTVYARTTDTVNLRSSDSEQADKVGKVSAGTLLQVVEQRLNGWSKVLYDGKEGFVKNDFLMLQESAEGQESLGTVKATTNINVRESANQESARLGVLAGGESVELLAREGDWCKIIYNGKVGYVKGEYVE